jgi:hypothetical protein
VADLARRAPNLKAMEQYKAIQEKEAEQVGASSLVESKGRCSLARLLASLLARSCSRARMLACLLACLLVCLLARSDKCAP